MLARSGPQPLAAPTSEQIKRVLCEHYGVPFADSELALVGTKFSHLYATRGHLRLILRHGDRTYEAFGKVTYEDENVICRSVYGHFRPTLSTEYDNLRQIDGALPLSLKTTPRPIGIVRGEACSVCVLEKLDGYDNLSTVIASFLLRPGTGAAAALALGRRVLDSLYRMQPYCSDLVEGPLDQERQALTDGLSRVKMLGEAEMRHLSVAMTDRLERLHTARRGIIHADLGARNVLVSDSGIMFVDWEAMLRGKLSVYDPCYFIVALMMRCVQIFWSFSKVDRIGRTLFSYAVSLERDLTPDLDDDAVRDSIWLGRLLALVHVLRRYEEQIDEGGLYSWLRRRRRQLRFLIDSVGRDAACA